MFFAYAKTTAGRFAMSITILNRLAQRKDEADTLPALAKKRSRNPELKALGHRLTELRGTRTRQQVCNRLTDLKVPLDASSLFQYEAGTVWAPDAGVLWGLAQIYEVAVDDLIALLRANRAQPTAAGSAWRTLLDNATADNLAGKSGNDLERTDRYADRLKASAKEILQTVLEMQAEARGETRKPSRGARRQRNVG